MNFCVCFFIAPLLLSDRPTPEGMRREEWGVRDEGWGRIGEGEIARRDIVNDYADIVSA